jgi:hypothetical protein
MSSNISHISLRLNLEKIGYAEGELIRFLAPRTVQTIINKLPIEGRAIIGKNNVYFNITLDLGSEKPKSYVEKGTIAYWPMGKAFCIFYDGTRPYSSVNCVGRILKNLEIFKKIKSGTKIKVEKI